MSGTRSGSRLRGMARRIRHAPLRFRIGVLLLVGVALLPLYLGPIEMLTMISAFYFVIFIVSWDFVSGYTGQMSFGHTLLFAIGGYTTGVLNIHHGIDPIISIPVGVVAATIGGFLFFGLPSLRLQGNYLVLVTLILPLIFLQSVTVFSDVFGGGDGMRAPDPFLQMENFTGTVDVHYYLGFGLFLLVFGLAYLITRSNTGRVFTAIREDQEVVEACGLSTTKFKLFAFTVSGFMGGLGGAFVVHSPVGSPSPEVLLAIAIMIEILLASVVGGLGTIVGPATGGFLIFWLQDWLQGSGIVVPGLDVPVNSISTLLFYVVMILLLFYLPEGIVPRLLRAGAAVRDRLGGRSGRTATDGGRPEPPATRIRRSHAADLRSRLEGDTDGDDGRDGKGRDDP